MRKPTRRIKAVQAELEHNLTRVVSVEVCHIDENQIFPGVQNSFWMLLAFYLRFLTPCTIEYARNEFGCRNTRSVRQLLNHFSR